MTITVGAFYLARQVLLPWTGLERAGVFIGNQKEQLQKEPA
jgi:hypothetical protein